MEYNNKHDSNIIKPLKHRYGFFVKNPILLLLVIGLIGLLLRLYYFHPDVPYLGDASNYFFYAIQTSNLGHLPGNMPVANNGWPAFLSIFFSIFQFNDALSYMWLQRFITIIISVLTIIPVYFLCNRFFDKPYSLVGAAIIAFEPRLIQNSLQGISDTLYIFLIAVSFALFLSNNKKLTFVSFVAIAFASMVRSEGLFLFLAISIMFFIKYRKDRLVIPKYVIAFFIFALILSPMLIYRTEAYGHDAFTTRALDTISFHLFPPEENSEAWEKLLPRQQEELTNSKTTGISFILTGVENFPKYLGWSLIPIFIFFVPIGSILIFKNLNYRILTIIVSTIIISIPAFYAYSIPLLDTRFIYFLFPLFCVLSIFTVKKFASKFKKQNLVLVLLVSGILISSGIFLDFKKTDYNFEKEAFAIAKHVVEDPKVINAELLWLPSAQVVNNWPNLKFENNSINPVFETKKISTKNFESLQNFIEVSKNAGLTHLGVDGKQRSDFLNDVFFHDEKYPYLIKEYDSLEHGYTYHVKIYRIDYELFNISK